MMDRLNPRERLLAYLALGLLGPLILFRLVLFPLMDLRDQYQAKAARLEKQVLLVRQLGGELRQLQASQPQRAESLNGRIGRVLRELDVLERASLASQNAQGGVQSLLVQLDNLTLYEASAVVYQTEHLRPQIQIENLDLMVSFQNSERLKLSMVVSAP
ncbi:MAG: hypothetical protein RRB13_03670 [bacterium]|nr:hypothetical protein [bacterium]